MEVVVHNHQEEASTSSYTKEGFSFPYFAAENDEENVKFHAFTEEKKRVFRFKRIHSINDRGRSSPFTSLGRKLGRFRVRYVLVQEPPKDDH